MSVGIGAAGDYYRVRLTRLNAVDGPEIEWREDILYRRPETAPVQEFELFRIEAVALDNAEDVMPLGVFESLSDAHEALGVTLSDLGILTRAEFEDRYFPAEDEV